MSETAEKFTRITPVPAYQMVAEAIEREILSGRLRPGDPIGTEAELVRQFGVNRSTVREGIRLLEQGGMVHRDSSRRLAVGLPHYDRLATRASRALMLHQVSFRELWEATMALSLASIELAVDRATPEEIAALDANIAATEAAMDDPVTVATLDSEFHLLLEKCGRNRVLELAREPSNMLIYPTTNVAVRATEHGTRRLIEAHRMLVESLRRRDRELGRLWTRRHLDDWRKGFEKAGMDLDQPVDLVTGMV
ncbi:MAG: FadR/GntR family transcriptional regulator [Ferrovibrio sp.]|uniref:FadR/GntR family transcriptional regulator n=1 Tax=Ferrovibrio sp. TaxID=1917215 RepID=UPI00391ABF10